MVFINKKTQNKIIEFAWSCFSYYWKKDNFHHRRFNLLFQYGLYTNGTYPLVWFIDTHTSPLSKYVIVQSVSYMWWCRLDLDVFGSLLRLLESFRRLTASWFSLAEWWYRKFSPEVSNVQLCRLAKLWNERFAWWSLLNFELMMLFILWSRDRSLSTKPGFLSFFSLTWWQLCIPAATVEVLRVNSDRLRISSKDAILASRAAFLLLFLVLQSCCIITSRKRLPITAIMRKFVLEFM